jgi:hypothetical protein
MWALCLAGDAPDRITALASLGVPAVTCPGGAAEPPCSRSAGDGIALPERPRAFEREL